MIMNYYKAALVLFFVSLSYLTEAADDNGGLGASFIFGDSLVDAGNNNYLPTLSKANMPPNGIDFKATNGNPTGRYTNGRTIGDLVGKLLNIKKTCYYSSFPFLYLINLLLFSRFRRRTGTTKLRGSLFGSKFHWKSYIIWCELCLGRRRDHECNWKNICQHSHSI